MVNTGATRRFEDKPAVRERTPIMIGLMGPSSSGKTYSALRLATGIQKVSGGDIYVIDTEAGRAKHYADNFRFRHVEFTPPFSPLDYLAAFEHCYKKGASVIIVDSMSHEHEGPGGVLEMHEAEHQRLGGKEATKMLAWSRPKQERRRLINSFLQMKTNFIFCFRAKEKMKMIPVPQADGKVKNEPQAQGFMPIGGDEFVYEMTLNCLLYPGSNGIPTWRSDWVGERMMMKLPAQFRGLFEKPQPLNEEIGRAIADWATGTKSNEFSRIAQQIVDASTLDELEMVVPELKQLKETKALPASELRALRESYGERQRVLQEYQRSLEEQDAAEAAIASGEVPYDPATGEVLQPEAAG